MVTPERRKELQSLAFRRANAILESWWQECTGEFQDEQELTDAELDLVLQFKPVVVMFSPKQLEAMENPI